MLSDDQLKALNTAHSKVRVIAWAGHEIVFRKANREEYRAYRRAGESEFEKSDRVDQLSQKLVVAFDDDTALPRCRERYTSFLEEYPAFADVQQHKAVFADLVGMIEEEDSIALGKAVSARNEALSTLARGSPNGSATVAAQPTVSSAPMAVQRPAS
jgi:hypothetical protein